MRLGEPIVRDLNIKTINKIVYLVENREGLTENAILDDIRSILRDYKEEKKKN